MADDPLLPSDALTPRPSGAQQWQSAIDEQRLRNIMAPSMPQQIMDIAGNTAQILGSPIINSAQRMQQAYEGGIDASMGGSQILDLLGITGSGYMTGAERGTVGALGGKPIMAFHGSGADFNQFSDEFIGTGEGAQMFGIGHYGAEHEPVALDYREKLGQGAWRVGDQPFDSRNPLHVAAARYHHLGRDQAIWDTNYFAQHARKRGGTGTSPFEDQVLAHLQSGNDLPQVTPPGHMYELAIHADPEHFVDYDKPLGQQRQEVQDVLRPIIEQLKQDPVAAGHLTGTENLDDHLIGHILDAAKAAARPGSPLGLQRAFIETALKDAGVPGIKYFDQGSRAAKEGSRNYVVFDPQIIEILRKYGIAGLAALPALGRSDEPRQ